MAYAFVAQDFQNQHDLEICYFCRSFWLHPAAPTNTSPEPIKTQTGCSVHFCSRAFAQMTSHIHFHPPSLPWMDPPEYSIACNFERAVCMHLFRFLVQHQAEYCKVAFSKPFQPRSHSLSPPFCCSDSGWSSCHLISYTGACHKYTQSRVPNTTQVQKHSANKHTIITIS